jgi:hypothetical protein
MGEENLNCTPWPHECSNWNAFSCRGMGIGGSKYSLFTEKFSVDMSLRLMSCR